MDELEKLSKLLDFHSELAKMLSQKKNLCAFFFTYKKLLLPDFRLIDLEFLLKVIGGQKKLVALAEVEKCGINFEGITVNTMKLQKYCCEHEVLRNYVPDTNINKEYALKVMSVLDVETLIKLNEITSMRAKFARNFKEKAQKNQNIILCPEFARILLAYPVSVRPATFKITPDITSLSFDQYLVKLPQKRQRVSKPRPASQSLRGKIAARNI